MSTKYIVMFTAGGRIDGAKIGSTELDAMQAYIAKFKAKYPDAVIFEQLGMAEVMLDDPSELAADPHVHYIEPLITLKPVSTIQENVPWHLANISGSVYKTYEYATTGKGITVYVADSGIDVSNAEFEGRAVRGLFYGEPTDPHGTHVAGLVGSKTYGVAKDCTIVDVQIFDPTQDASEGAVYLLQGINYILTNHVNGTPGVVNFSIGGPDEAGTQPYKDAIKSMIVEGLVVVIAAGNENVNASTFFPSNIPEVITVGAIDDSNTRASFSNYGAIVDVFAPGVNVQSTVLNLAAASLNGTSMAAPIVAGVCARYLELSPQTTPVDVQTYIKQYAISDVVMDKPSTTTKRINVNMPGIRSTLAASLSTHLNGEYRTTYSIGGIPMYGGYKAYGEVKRLTVLKRFSSQGSMALAAEVIKVTLPDTVFPIVTPPLVLPADVWYDGSRISFRADYSISFKNVIYMPTSHVDNVYSYNYPGLVVLTLTLLADNDYSLSGVSQLPPGPGGSGGSNGSVGDEEIGTWPSKFDAALYPLPINPKKAAMRYIVIDCQKPEFLTSINMSLQYATGTFSYSGAKFNAPKNKQPITMQGHNALVERVALSASRGQAPITVEGRLIPLFTAEMIYINKTAQRDGTPYLIAEVVAEVAQQAGTSVSFKATNSKIKSFEFTGRFTQALEQLAELACGKLLQQNGAWMILSKHTPQGSFVVPLEDVISVQSNIQSDILDMIASLLGSFKDATLEADAAARAVDRAQNKLDHVAGIENLPSDPIPKAVTGDASYLKMGGISFAFGWNGRDIDRIPDQIVVEASDASVWDTWKEGTTAPSARYYKMELITNDEGVVLFRKGLKSLSGVNLLYPINPPSNVALYNATGTLSNMYCSLWAGTDHIAASMSPVTRTKAIAGLANTAVQYPFTYFEFRSAISNVGYDNRLANDDKNYYKVDMELSYKPALLVPWKFTVSIDKTYRLLQSLNYLIPIDGGAVLNINGNTVAQFDRTARVLKLQDGTVVGSVLCRPDTVVDGSTIKGAPYSAEAPAADPEGTTVTMTGAILDDRYVLRTKVGRLFGTVHITDGIIRGTTENTIGTYVSTSTGVFSSGSLWTSAKGNVLGLGSTASTPNYVGIVLNADATDSTGTISFNDAVDFPPVVADPNYTTLQTTLIKNEKAESELDAAVAEAKKNCFKKELTFYGVDTQDIDKACDEWKKYYDAIEERDFPKLVTPPAVAPAPKTDKEIKELLEKAITQTQAAIVGANVCKARERVISVSFVYNNIMPLPGATVKVNKILGSDIDLDGSDIIETVTFNGSTVTITASKGYTAND